MTREETKMIITMLSSIYVTEFSKRSEEQVKQMIDVWSQLFEDEDANKIATVTKAYLKTNTNAFMPTPAMLINMAFEIYEPKGLTEQEAWNYIAKAISNSGYNSKEEYDKLPEEIKPMTSPNQLKEYSQMDSSQLETVVASNFMRSYKVRAKNTKDFKMLPSSIQAQISDLTKTMLIDDNGYDMKDKLKAIEKL